MARTKRGLFRPLVPEAKTNKSYRFVRDSQLHVPGRETLEDVFSTFEDSDGNFIEQFQSTGFDSRIWELYLYAYFSRSGFDVTRPRRPDFLVARGGTTVAVEAVTSNPSVNQRAAQVDETGLPVRLTAEQVLERQQNLIPVRLGGPLTDKLKKRYWELPEVTGSPLVLAVAPFYDEYALEFSDAALANYLYGLRFELRRDSLGRVYGESFINLSHRLGQKVIPSGFFSLPDGEHVSAVLFSNAGTAAKFNRMGQQGHFRNSSLTMIRRGMCYDHDPRAADAAFFQYVVGHPEFNETWGEGIFVFHNPRATVPLPPNFFTDDVAQGYLRDGLFSAKMPEFHPFASKTLVFNVEEPVGLRAKSGIRVNR